MAYCHNVYVVLVEGNLISLSSIQSSCVNLRFGKRPSTSTMKSAQLLWPRGVESCEDTFGTPRA